jgi:hypothetical protein
MVDLLETIRLAADDPMWADHAEIPKKLLRHVADRLEALERQLAERDDENHKATVERAEELGAEIVRRWNAGRAALGAGDE